MNRSKPGQSSALLVLLKRLSGIEDTRNPKKIKHKLWTLMIYGILTFIRFICETTAHPRQDYEWPAQRLIAPFQLRLV